LRREHNAETKRTALLQQRQQRQLRRRIRDRREVTKNLVHVENRAQTRSSRLCSDPTQHLIQQQRHEEHALRIAEMRD
jgi:hypothetical protein